MDFTKEFMRALSKRMCQEIEESIGSTLRNMSQNTVDWMAEQLAEELVTKIFRGDNASSEKGGE